MARVSASIVRGSASLLVAQILIAVTQFAYSGLTSRQFPVAWFGGFAVAMAGAALLGLLLTSGVPTYVLAQDDWSAKHSAAARFWSGGGGLLGSALLYLLGPAWASLWRSSASTYFTAALTPYVLVAALAATELAALRREGRPGRDALAQGLGTLCGVVVGLGLVMTTGAKWSLAVSPTASAICMFIMAVVLRRNRGPWQGLGNLGSLFPFVTNVSFQNLNFFVLTSAPSWAVSVSSTPVELGFFSRGALLVTMAFYAVSNALNRSLQPFYRLLSDEVRRREAITDSLVCGAAFAFPAFWGVAALAEPLTYVWLGPGWGPAARVMAVMAVGYGVYIVFGLAANAAEMLGEFRAVRSAQLLMTVPALAFVVGTIMLNNSLIAAATYLGCALAGLLGLGRQLARRRMIDARRLGRQLAAQGTAAAAPAILAWSIVRTLGHYSGPSYSAALTQVALGSTVLAIGWALALRRQPAVRILYSRGILSKGTR